MANLQIKGMDDKLYRDIKKLAVLENRSVSQQVLFVLKAYMANNQKFREEKTPAQTLLELSGSWDDSRSSEQIVDQIRKARINSKKLSKGF